MACFLQDKMLQFNNDTYESVRKGYNLDKPGSMDGAIDAFEAWVKKQEHFTKKDFSRGYLERTILGCKGSVERAKGRLDKLCTFRTLMPHFFEDFDVKDFGHLDGKIIHLMLPKLTQNNERLLMARYFGKDFNPKMVYDGFRVALLHSEYSRQYDYARAAEFIVDFRDASIAEFIKNINIVELRQLSNIIIEGYGIIVKKIHVLTDSKLIDLLIAIAKQVLTDKLFNRIRVHKTLDALLEVVPKELLPEELGGTQGSIEDLNAQWMDVLGDKDFKNQWNEMSSAKTNESLRQTDKFNDQYMGMPGTFRMLSVD